MRHIGAQYIQNLENFYTVENTLKIEANQAAMTRFTYGLALAKAGNVTDAKNLVAYAIRTDNGDDPDLSALWQRTAAQLGIVTIDAIPDTAAVRTAGTDGSAETQVEQISTPQSQPADTTIGVSLEAQLADTTIGASSEVLRADTAVGALSKTQLADATQQAAPIANVTPENQGWRAKQIMVNVIDGGALRNWKQHFDAADSCDSTRALCYSGPIFCLARSP